MQVLNFTNLTFEFDLVQVVSICVTCFLLSFSPKYVWRDIYFAVRFGENVERRGCAGVYKRMVLIYLACYVCASILDVCGLHY